MDWLDQVKWDAHGLVPVIAQEVGSNDVLMFAWMNREALHKTAELGRAVYFSRSRGKLWFKGEESGHVQTVHEIRLDCDNDVVLLKVTQLGHGLDRLPHRPPQLLLPALPGRRLASRGAGLERSGNPSTSDDMSAPMTPCVPCQTRRRSPAWRRSSKAASPPAAATRETSYVARLLHRGPDAFLKKIGEEATEVVMAAKDVDRAQAPMPGASWWTKSPTCGSTRMIALAHYGLAPADVIAELERREGTSGIEEKALRKAGTREPEGGLMAETDFAQFDAKTPATAR